MKIRETFKEEDDKIIIKKTHDFTPVMKRMDDIRQNVDQDLRSDYRYVGTIPLPLMEQWCKEAGVKWDDVHARAEVVKRKILSGDFDKLRGNWKGRY